MKIAICFFGIIRSLEYVIDSIQDNIFDVLNKVTYVLNLLFYRLFIAFPIDSIYQETILKFPRR